jgi:hypothetical protein
VVEGARLESVCRGNSTVGSNPTLSANSLRRVGWSAWGSGTTRLAPLVVSSTNPTPSANLRQSLATLAGYGWRAASGELTRRLSAVARSTTLVFSWCENEISDVCEIAIPSQGTTISTSFEAAVMPHGVTAFTRTTYVPLGAGTLIDAVPTGITATFVRLGAEPASMR